MALGVKAIEHAFSVVFYRLDEMLRLMRRDGELSPSLLRRKKYINNNIDLVLE